MKKISSHSALCTGLFVFIFSICIPLDADAATRRRGESAYRTKINKLDDDKVENLSIPILFGITLGMLSPNFGDPRDGGARTHEGEDIIAPKGAPIVSPTEAVVTRTGTQSGSGKYVSTANPGGETFVFMHLSEILVNAGDELDMGDIIGYVGNTGNASGGAPHLHFEVRDGRKATDPFPRLASEFSLKKKIKFLTGALTDVDDEDELVDFVVQNYHGELSAAKAAGIVLPKDIDKALQNIPQTTPSGTQSPLEATLGSNSPIVSLIQTLLILKDTGPAARALAGAGATGYFGQITQAALIEYQLKHNISPANGYFGPQTLMYMLTNEGKK